MYAQKAWPQRYGKYFGIVEILDVRQLLAHRGVAQPHGRLGVQPAEGQVLGHAFDEPQRKLERGHGLADRPVRSN